MGGQYWESTPESPDCTLPASAVREQVSKILRSSNFTNAPNLGRLLQYLVGQLLEGKAHEVKQYSIATEVFGRGEAFDAKTDTIVRVQARRLRVRLQSYYEREGRSDPISIRIPTGSYLAVCERASQAGARSIAGDTSLYDSARDRAEPIRRSVRLPPPLPAPRTSLIGRESDVAAITKRLLSEEARLLTITGAGGSGKTRIALHVARALNAAFPGGVYLAPLAALTDPGSFDATVAQLMGVRQTWGRPLLEALEEHFRLAVRSPTLLIFDNFEHILPAAPLIPRLLDACSALKVLVTSRAVLHVYGEYEYPISPLPVPHPDRVHSLEDLSENPAVRLFLQRATAASPAFALTQKNARAVVGVCARLDGLPLALELAASRLKVLSPADLLQRLRKRMELLNSGAGDLPARQQTLQRTVDWSYDLLSEAEQRLFRRLSVFSGGFTLEGAEAVCNTACDLDTDLLEGITSLADKSLLTEAHEKDTVVRFGMLETIREYALERLITCGEEEKTKRAHSAYCLVIAEEGNPQLTPAERLQWLALSETEHDNYRAALDFLIASNNAKWAFRMGVALFTFWERKEYLAEGRERLAAILAMEGAQARTKERARVTFYAGTLATNQGDYETAIATYRNVLALYRQLGDKRGAISQLNNLGVNRSFQGDYPSAVAWYEESLAECRELGDQAETAAVLSNLASIVGRQNDHCRARSLLGEALSIFEQIDDSSSVAWSYSHLGDLAQREGKLSEAYDLYHKAASLFGTIGDDWGVARSYSDLGYLGCEQDEITSAELAFGEALGAFQHLGHQRGVAKVLEGFAVVAARQAEPERTLTLAGAAAALREAMGVPPRPGEQAAFESTLNWAKQNTQAARAKDAWDSGRRMTLDQCLRYAIEDSESRPATTGRS